MDKPEAFYTSALINKKGIGIYLNHVREFLEGKRTVPVAKTSSHLPPHGDIFFTFSENLFRAFDEDFLHMKKPFAVALNYGFRGYSSGGKNGIFLLREGMKRYFKR